MSAIRGGETVLVTGAAGFIGGNILRGLNARGIRDIVAVDGLSDGTKFHNLAASDIADYWDQDELLERLGDSKRMPRLRAVIHQGACSDTTEWDGRYVMRVNYAYSRTLLDYCLERQVPLIYASSASVYGTGTTFQEAPANEHPLNVYGYSKLLFDNRVRSIAARARSQVVGLRYFNVYGPGEQHKGGMASVVYRFDRQLRDDGSVRLFEGSHGYGAGEQRRDFIFVDDVVGVNMWFLERPHLSGIYNLGTGISRSFNDAARAVIAWHGQGDIEYVPFPEHLKGRYQAFTEADLDALRKVGFDAAPTSLEAGVRAYLDRVSSPRSGTEIGPRGVLPRLPAAPRCGERRLHMMRCLYSVAMTLLAPILLIRVMLRSLADPDYRHRWTDRLGLVEPLSEGPPVIWLHAVSVGEVQAAVPLIRTLQQRYGDCRLLVTTTPTGWRRVVAAFGDSVEHRFLPFDAPMMVNAFLRRTRPSFGILIETELWPNLVNSAVRRGMPLVLANARLSERSARGYRRAGSLTRAMLRNLSLLAAQSRDDADRFIALGAPAERVEITGNIKLDVHLSASVSEAAQVLRRAWGPHRSVWIAASTHAGEEAAVLEVHQCLRQIREDVLLILVPRHPDRAGGVSGLCRRAGLKVVRRSETVEPPPTLDVYLGDTMGDLPVLYAASDVAFVGGSLVDVGGHNMLEPAALGVPVVLGPSVFNFADLAARILAVGAGIEVRDADELACVVERLLDDADRRHAMGEVGREFVQANRGAVAALAESIRPLVDGAVRTSIASCD